MSWLPSQSLSKNAGRKKPGSRAHISKSSLSLRLVAERGLHSFSADCQSADCPPGGAAGVVTGRDTKYELEICLPSPPSSTFCRVQRSDCFNNVDCI